MREQKLYNMPVEPEVEPPVKGIVNDEDQEEK